MTTNTPNPALFSVVMLGASGAVGGAALTTLLAMPEPTRLTLLVRRKLAGVVSAKVSQHVVDVFDPKAYKTHLTGHDAAICTFGVGESSKVSKDEFIRVDKTAVLDFATACKAAGVRHFEMLSAVASDAQSASFYLRVKGEMQDALIALNFERLSLFQPSMILTPTNRYGLMQGLTLAVWPKLTPLLAGPLRKYRGVDVAQLGAAMAKNLLSQGYGTEFLQWDKFAPLAG
jgi:uncharacterized protein YbjT (DUF2867 family)